MEKGVKIGGVHVTYGPKGLENLQRDFLGVEKNFGMIFPPSGDVIPLVCMAYGILATLAKGGPDG